MTQQCQQYQSSGGISKFLLSTIVITTILSSTITTTTTIVNAFVPSLPTTQTSFSRTSGTSWKNEQYMSAPITEKIVEKEVSYSLAGSGVGSRMSVKASSTVSHWCYISLRDYLHVSMQIFYIQILNFVTIYLTMAHSFIHLLILHIWINTRLLQWPNLSPTFTWFSS